MLVSHLKPVTLTYASVDLIYISAIMAITEMWDYEEEFRKIPSGQKRSYENDRTFLFLIYQLLLTS